jgi:hypothetical protein
MIFFMLNRRAHPGPETPKSAVKSATFFVELFMLFLRKGL